MRAILVYRKDDRRNSSLHLACRPGRVWAGVDGKPWWGCRPWRPSRSVSSGQSRVYRGSREPKVTNATGFRYLRQDPRWQLYLPTARGSRSAGSRSKAALEQAVDQLRRHPQNITNGIKRPSPNSASHLVQLIQRAESPRPWHNYPLLSTPQTTRTTRSADSELCWRGSERPTSPRTSRARQTGRSSWPYATTNMPGRLAAFT